jgi:hypothetical protein
MLKNYMGMIYNLIYYLRLICILLILDPSRANKFVTKLPMSLAIGLSLIEARSFFSNHLVFLKLFSLSSNFNVKN